MFDWQPGVGQLLSTFGANPPVVHPPPGHRPHSSEAGACRQQPAGVTNSNFTPILFLLMTPHMAFCSERIRAQEPCKSSAKFVSPTGCSMIILMNISHVCIFLLISLCEICVCCCRESTPTSQQERDEEKKPHIKKPLNAFMLYMREERPKVVAQCKVKESATINQILGQRVSECVCVCVCFKYFKDDVLFWNLSYRLTRKTL